MKKITKIATSLATNKGIKPSNTKEIAEAYVELFEIKQDSVRYYAIVKGDVVKFNNLENFILKESNEVGIEVDTVMAKKIAKSVEAYVPTIKEERNIISFKNKTYEVNFVTKDIKEIEHHASVNSIPHNLLTEKEIAASDKHMAARDKIVELLRGWVGDDPENTGALLKMLGYTMLKNNYLQKIFYIYGGAGTGKSSFGTMMNTLLGTENIGIFEDTKNNNHISEAIAHKLVAFNDDIQDGHINNVGMVKSMSAGGTININPKGKPAYGWKSFATPVLISNLEPKWSDKTSGAIEDRIVIIEFNNKKFRGTSKQIDSIEALFEQKHYQEVITAMAFAGLEMLFKKGFKETESQTSIKSKIINENNIVHGFAKEFKNGYGSSLLRNNKKNITSGEIFGVFKKWVQEENYKTSYTKRNFTLLFNKETGLTSRVLRIDGEVKRAYDLSEWLLNITEVEKKKRAEVAKINNTIMESEAAYQAKIERGNYER